MRNSRHGSRPLPAGQRRSFSTRSTTAREFLYEKRTKIILAVFLAFLLLLGVGGYAYMADYYHADEVAVAAMAYQADDVQIEEDGNVTWFVPKELTAGLIFYPGGKVEHTACAPLLWACAEKGILWDARQPGSAGRQCGRWAARKASGDHNLGYIAGHSLGGAMAANYAAAHSDDYSGLILLAAYSTKYLTRTSPRVLSVYGSEDGVMNREAYKKDWVNLPADTAEVILEGGCHAQFGSYGSQEDDGTPTILGKEQIRQTTEAIVAFAVP